MSSSAADVSAEELSEEDQTLKNELEMLVARLKVYALDNANLIRADVLCRNRNPIQAFIYPRLTL